MYNCAALQAWKVGREKKINKQTECEKSKTMEKQSF